MSEIIKSIILKAIHSCILITVIFAISSCSFEPSKTKLLAQAIWKFSDMTSSSSDSLTLAKLTSSKKFLAGQELRFKVDSSFLSLFPSHADVNGNSGGKWKFSADQTKLIMIGNGNESMWDIEKLDEESLAIKHRDLNLNVDFSYHYKKK